MCYQVMLHFFIGVESVSKPAHEKVTEGEVNKFFDSHVFGLNQYSECLDVHSSSGFFLALFL